MEVIVSELSYELQLFNAEYNYYYHHFLPYAFASNKYSNEFSFSNRVFNGALSIRLCIDSKSTLTKSIRHTFIIRLWSFE